MTSEHSHEYEMFNAFITERFGGDIEGTSLEEALVTFRAYQRQLAKLRKHLQPSITEADQGKTQPLDLDAVMARVEMRLHQQDLH